MLLGEPQVLQAMEHERSDGAALSAPAGEQGAATISGSVASAAQLGRLGSYVDRLLRQIVRRAAAAATSTPIPAATARRTASAATATVRRPVISRTGRTGDQLRYILPVKSEEFWQELWRKEAASHGKTEPDGAAAGGSGKPGRQPAGVRRRRFRQNQGAGGAAVSVCGREEHCHVDDFLIITYTKAAAAELRSKIAAELSKRLAEAPGDRHLRSQLLRVYQADIKTVDAFCTALLRENTHLLAA